MQALWGQCLQQVRDRGLTPRADRGGAAAHAASSWCSPRIRPKPSARSSSSITGACTSCWSSARTRCGRPTSSARSARRSRRCCRCCGGPARSSCRSPTSPPSGATSCTTCTAVFPDVLPVLDRRLRQTWAHLGFDPELLRAPEQPAALPSEHLGGRRSRRSSARHRGGHASDAGRPAPARPAAAAASAAWRSARQSSLSDRLQPPPPALRDRVATAGRASSASADGRSIHERAGRDLAATGRPDARAACRSRASIRKADGCARARAAISAPANCSRIFGCCTTRSSPSARGAWPTRPWRPSSGPCRRSAFIWRRSTSARTAASTIWRSAQLLAAAGFERADYPRLERRAPARLPRSRARVAAAVPARGHVGGPGSRRGAGHVPGARRASARARPGRPRRAHRQHDAAARPTCSASYLFAREVGLTTTRRTGWPAGCRSCRCSRRSTTSSAARTSCAPSCSIR